MDRFRGIEYILSAGIKQYSFNGIVKCIEEYFANGTKQPLFNTLSLCGTPIKEANGYAEQMWQPQHLYITSNEEIKEDDWFINIDQLHRAKPIQHQNKHDYLLDLNSHKKIIATTDESLTEVAQIPEAFIKKFVESQGSITEVLVTVYGKDDIAVITEGEKIGTPILRANNTIIISPSKTYTREEMIDFGKKCGTAGTMAERTGEDYNLLFLQLVEKML